MIKMTKERKNGNLMNNRILSLQQQIKGIKEEEEMQKCDNHINCVSCQDFDKGNNAQYKMYNKK